MNGALERQNSRYKKRISKLWRRHFGGCRPWICVRKERLVSWWEEGENCKYELPEGQPWPGRWCCSTRAGSLVGSVLGINVTGELPTPGCWHWCSATGCGHWMVLLCGLGVPCHLCTVVGTLAAALTVACHADWVLDTAVLCA